MCAVPGAGRRASSSIVVCTPPAGAGLVAAAAEVLGIDEVWALGGPAGDRLARLRPQGRQDRRARERLRERGEARGPARRRDRPAGRPVRGRRRRRRRRRPADRRARARRAGRARRPTRVCRVVETLEEAEAIAPEHLVLLGEAEALAGAGAERRRGLRRAVVARRGRRLRDRRQPRPADERLGALGRRARASRRSSSRSRRSGSRAEGLALLRPTVEALAAAEGMPAHAAAVRR